MVIYSRIMRELCGNLSSGPWITMIFSLADGNKSLFTNLWKLLLLFPLVLWVMLLPDWVFSYMHALVNNLLNNQRGLLQNLWDSLSVQLSPLMYSVMWTLATFAGLSNITSTQGVYPVSAWIPFPCQETLRTSSCGDCSAQLIVPLY